MNLRELVIKILVEVEKNHSYANLLLPKVIKKLPKKEDRDFVLELTYGVIKQIMFLDYMAEKLLKKRSKLPPFVVNALRVGLYQLYFLDKVPTYAAINETVEAVKKNYREFSGLVNGVLRNFLRNKDEIIKVTSEDSVKYLAITYSHPEWMVERWLKQFGYSRTEEILKYNNGHPNLALRINTLKVAPKAYGKLLTEKGINFKSLPFVPEAIIILDRIGVTELPGFNEGLFYIQDIGSILIAYLVNPEPNSVGIDACAAPGGKTTHLAQLMQNQGVIYAFDLHSHRIKLVEENARRLGVEIIRCATADATKLRLPEENRIDWILADVPCSGTGVLARRPDARWQKSPDEIIKLSQYQLEILTHLAMLLPPGGIIVYSTCSLEYEENEGVIENFFKRHSNFTLIKPPELFYNLGVISKEFYVRMLPGELGDGFFGAKLLKLK
ncbi:16S rRNA (cytosine(967)-C(5))-methyltransferase RsmB [Carboxydothermus pertinax]|uniref:16S rRNA (cytosine(967)-C(5))-methyltransferase n=1 Tax=Carboxydothermus pertinax TaxID=870242 RepID=A0A1L8CXV1_9THEO|nr:16S rRNA (cytosine(967)-C(5))-methyltransferase RsmB [Carboxydothermus pertinax]GAV23723.1 16S rRNA (cytosine(967)-C(5))-methyltransferase [Carboxydothermus pertinax]